MTDASQFMAMFQYPLTMNDRIDIVYSATNEGIKTTRDHFIRTLKSPEMVYNRAKDHVEKLLSGSLEITTPVENFNTGYRWALIATDRFFVNTPGMGKSLVAGYSTTKRGWDGGHKINGRPGYGWYFGRDGEWSGFALLDYGDFSKVKAELEFFQKFQDLSGKILHEASTSGVVHYDASDASPLYIVLAGKYFRHTNDTAFLRKNWPSVKKAIDFCFSTDTDKDHLIENTNVGHGWVEGGELYGSHATLYNAGAWSKALEEASNMARFMKDPEQESYQQESDIVNEIVNTNFWNRKTNFYSYGKNKDGSYRNDPTVLPAVPMSFKIIDKDKAKPVLNQYASNAFSTNWGVRILRDDNPWFNPNGYHYGSVWPLFTGWASMAEFAYRNYQQGYTHLMNNLNVYKNWGKGFVEEVLNGSEYKPSGVCPHQCWSETMVLQPAIEGLLGLEIHAQEKKIILAPHPPADWDSLKVENIRIEKQSLLFRMDRHPDRYIYSFIPERQKDLTLEFVPSYPSGTIISKVLLDGQDIPYTTFNLQQNISLLVNLRVNYACVVEVFYEKGIAVLPVVPDPKPGDHAAGLRIISSSFKGNQYRIELEDKPRTDEELTVYVHGQEIAKIDGGRIRSHNGDYAILTVQFDPSGEKYAKKTIVITLK